MSVLGTISPNIPRSQSVISSNIRLSQDLTEHDATGFKGPPAPHTTNGDLEKSEDGETLQRKEPDVENRVVSLARRLTRQSTRLTSKSTLENPFFLDDLESTLNPQSPNFRARDWMKMLLEIRSRDPEKYPDRTAGVAFKRLSVHGFGSPTDYQKDVLNVLFELGTIARRLVGIKMPRIQILRDFEGLVRSGEMLVVLGRPGSGCSTFLKTIAGEMNGIQASEDSVLNYQGKATYTAETDVHFPQLSVADTLTFAALARALRNRIKGVSQKQYAEHIRDVVMAIGGERKHVSIAEATLSQAPLQCWDNSTRGLNSANTLKFICNLVLIGKYTGSSACVAIYQALQSAYDVFDKATVLYEGRQIYFGTDFLTSLTSPLEHLIRPRYEDRVPRTPDEFAVAWKRSDEHAELLCLVDARKAMQSKRQRVKSPYTISVWQQVSICAVRGFQRLRGDFSLTATALIGNFSMALIIGFYYRGALLFFAVVMNAFSSALEILTLYAQRPIVEKQSRYAFYHPFAEAVASMLCDTPYKLINSFTFNVPLYLITNLRRDAALAPAAIIILGMVIYTGFTIPTHNMLGWFRWMNYINPIAYTFESFMANEFDGHQFECAQIIPSSGYYDEIPMQNRICATVGAESGSSIVDGALFIELSYNYSKKYISEQKSKGEVHLFRRGQQPNLATGKADPENLDQPASGPKTEESAPRQSARIQRQTAIFHWEDVCYDIKIKEQLRKFLDHVDSWVEPGTCTALMGVSRAGKIILLDVLATRVTMGVDSGLMLRKTFYMQQQDLHLATLTVREALRFSVLLCQPAHLSQQEKIDYVEEVIMLLGMEAYTDAIVGVPGEGLNLLLFLDEPTSGLDTMLFQRFDQLLLPLASGGRTIYFSDIRENSSTLTSYFVQNGSQILPPGDNLAEWMLDVIGAAPGTHSNIDWVNTWRESPEYGKVREHLSELKSTLLAKLVDKSDISALSEFAAPFYVQLWECLVRVFAQYYHTPTYIWSKAALCVLTALYIGFSFFNAPTSLQGLQNQMFSVFMLMTIFGNLVQQIMPNFVTQRSLHEARERLSKAYSWKAFIVANILPTDTVTERGSLMFLLLWTFLLFTSTFAHMIIAGIELTETGGNVASLLFSLCLIFCGVLSGPNAMPGFWISMYRVSPFTYLVSAMLSTGLSGTSVECEAVEYLNFNPPKNLACSEYMQDFIDATGAGYLQDPDATSQCAFCTMDKTDTFLLGVSSRFDEA
ncbi:hypothetical protein BJX70DRAFT_409126 [Aspergillus crustosus]